MAQALAELGFGLLATAGTAAMLAEAGLEVTTLEKGGAVVDAIRTGRCNLVINTPQGSGARRDGALIRADGARRARALRDDALRCPTRRRRDRERARRDRALPAGTDQA